MDDRDFSEIESIYDELDAGRPERALALARELRHALPEDDPVLRFLAGRALVELDRPAEAVGELRRAVELDPHDAEFRTDLAESLYLSLQLTEALEHGRRAVELDDAFADAHYLLALILERGGQDAEAARHFERAAALDGESFPAPCQLSGDEFARQLENARARLPETFRGHLDSVAVMVETLPPESLLTEESPPLSPELLGLFVGVTLDGQSYMETGGELPPRIYLFKRNLERAARDADELAEQIRITLYHELGHYLGMDEDDLNEAGYA
jgi:predicted Zn-dependent protease with MMP-like domain